MQLISTDQLVDTLLRFAQGGGDRPVQRSPLPYLTSVIRMVSEGRLDIARGVLNRRLRLRNHAWQRLTAEAARRLSGADHGRADELARQLGGHAEQWWTS